MVHHLIYVWTPHRAQARVGRMEAAAKHFPEVATRIAPQVARNFADACNRAWRIFLRPEHPSPWCHTGLEKVRRLAKSVQSVHKAPQGIHCIKYSSERPKVSTTPRLQTSRRLLNIPMPRGLPRATPLPFSVLRDIAITAARACTAAVLTSPSPATSPAA